MYFRFAAAVALVVLVSLAGTLLEKATLRLRREISRQHYRTDVLVERSTRLRLRAQQLGGPQRLIEAIESGRLPLRRPDGSGAARKRP